MIGDVSRRIALERPDREEDAGGGAEVVWVPVAVVWASIRSSASGEEIASDDFAARVSHELRLRWRDDVRPGWRVLHGGRELRVRAAVDRDGARRWLHLECEEELR